MSKTCFASAALAALAVLAAVNFAGAQTLRVDIGVADGVAGVTPNVTPNQVPAGFSSFAFDANATSGFGDEYNSFNPPSTPDTQTFGGITVTVTAAAAGYVQPDPGGMPVYAEYRDRNGEVTTADPDVGDLIEEFVFAREGDLTLTLTGLAAGPYSMTTYHHDASFVQPTAGPITVNTGSGATTVPGGGVVISTGFGSAGSPVTPSSRTFDFTATGGDVVITFEDGPNGESPFLNAFVLQPVPEPATGLLALLAAPLLLRRRQAIRA